MIVLNTSPRSIAQTTRLGLGLCALIFMTACGGGGSDTAPDTTPTIPAVSGKTDPVTPIAPGSTGTGAQMRSAATALIDDYDPITYTALSTIPTTASADYSGYFFGDLANRTDEVTNTLIGTMTMRVGFTANSVTISGSVSNFSDENDDVVTGSITLSDGNLNRDPELPNDVTFTAAFDGDLTDADGRLLELSGQLEGDFLATGHRAVGGAATGKVEGSFAQNFDGGFIVER